MSVVTRARRFWVALVLIGAATPLLAALMATPLFALLTFAIDSSGGDAPLSRLAQVFPVLLAFAPPLVPLGMIAVPLSYRLALRAAPPDGSRAEFIWMATLFGMLGPVVLDGLLWAADRILALRGTYPFGISVWYALLGAGAAPLTALILWPALRWLDRRIGAQPTPKAEERRSGG
jgi:hypothetical protein